MDSAVDSVDWMLYSALSGAAGWDAGPAQLIVWGPESGRSVRGRCWRPVSLCRQVWPWAVLSVQLPLSAGLSDGLCGFPRVLGELAGQGQRLMAVCSTKCSYRLVSLPKHSRSSSLKITNAMSVVSH